MAMRNTRDDRKPDARDKNPARLDALPLEAKGHHAQLLSTDDVAKINTLDTQVKGGEGARYDIAETLMDPETLSSLQHYRSFFEMGGVTVDDALDTLPDVIELARMERHLTRALEVVHRNLRARVAPLGDTASNVHRLIVGTPEHSAMRAAFQVFEQRWRETFPGGRPPKTEAANAPAEPARPPK